MRRFFGEALKNIVPITAVPWMALGDFNAILYRNDKKRASVIERCYPYFGEFVKANDLHDWVSRVILYVEKMMSL